MKKRIPVYILGLFVMAFGVVLIKKGDLGMSPISSIPAAVANITPFTLGNTTIAFHVLCILLQILLLRKLTLKMILLLPLAVVFGYIIDLYMFILKFGGMTLWLRCVISFAGIVFTALGIVIIVGVDLMLPAPDAFLRAASQHFNKPLGTVKIIGDVTWVAITVIIELLSRGKIISVGIGTLASMYLTGKFVSLFKKWLPWLDMTQTDGGKAG